MSADAPIDARAPGDTPIITALDFADPADAEALADRLEPSMTRLKIGNQLFTLAGPALVERLQRRGFELFLDLKFHDIPNTVGAAVAAAASLGVWMTNVHAGGGPRMLDAARNAVARAPGGAGGAGGAGGTGGTRVIGVTVLTSDADADLVAVGIDESAAARVERLARLVVDAGLDGVVCSAAECRALRALAPPGFLFVTPGIRPADASGDDQRRTVTPADALAAGSDHLVIGRPVTAAADPPAALRAILADLDPSGPTTPDP